MFKRSKICLAAVLAVGGTVMITAMPTVAQTLERVEVTGSRIKRAEAEGALPVTVIKREELVNGGTTTVAEFLRTTTFASFGNFRPQSGSSAQGFSSANLRGLGSQRTLVLVDGRRIAKDPQVGDSADMNSIPMAAVERVEILTDGASAVYGSDAIGGVINFILRKDFEGGEVSIRETRTNAKGGDGKEMSAVFGVVGEKGRVLVGASATSREIIFVRDYPWGAATGASSYSNNYFASPGLGGFLGAVGGQATCDKIGNGFYFANGRCRYDFNLVAADEAAIGNKSMFGRAEVKINEDWTAYLNASVSRTDTFGRYAPVPGELTITPGSPGDLLHRNAPYYVGHRFAAAGNRDNTTDRNLYDTSMGVNGRLGGWDLEMGLRHTTSKIYTIGRGYIIRTLAEQAVNDGTYDLTNPYGASPEVLASFTATTSREGTWVQREFFASASRDVFKMSGGDAMLSLVGEARQERYSDQYDSLSEGGVVLGSSGNSAAGNRTVKAFGAELLLPVLKSVEVSLAARYEKYSDYGNDFSPKISVRFQPTKTLTLRSSYGEGFSAPSLPQLNGKPSFSADSIVDRTHCLADGNSVAVCDANPKPSFQINGTVISNRSLKSEKSKQYSFGGVWDVLPNLNLEATYWHTKLDGVITDISAQTIVNRSNGTSNLPIPAGLSMTRDATGYITSVIRGSTNEGTLEAAGIDFSAQLSHKWQTAGDFRHNLRYSRATKWATNGDDVLGTFGAPKDRMTLTNDWTRGSFGATWVINLIGKNGDDGVGYVPTYVTNDLQLRYDTPLKGVRLTVGALNIANKLPVLVSDNSKPFNYDLYDAYGRQAYAKVNYRF